MKKKMFLRKTVAGALVFTMVSSNTILAASETKNVIVDNLNTAVHTNVRDVNFGISLSYKGQKLSNIISDVNKDEQSLFISLDLRKGGYLEEGRIELSSGDERIFEVLNPGTNSLIDRVEGNVIYLNRFAGKNTTVELPVKFVYEGNITKDIVKNDIEAKFTGKYVALDGKVEEVKKDTKLTVNWIETKEISLKNEVLKYLKTKTAEKENIVLQTAHTAELQKNIKSMPVESYSLELALPKISEKYPDAISIALADTKGISLEDSLTYNAEKTGYIKETGTLKVVIDNKELEDKSLPTGEGQIRVVVTSVYDNAKLEEEQLDVEIQAKANILGIGGNVQGVKEEKTVVTLKDIVGEVVSGQMNLLKSNISKNKLYLNSVNGGGNDEELVSNVIVNISNKQINGSVKVSDKNLPYYQENKGLVEEGLKYKEIRIQKQNLTSVLGEDGNVSVISQGQKIGEINKNSKEVEGKLVLELPEEIKTVEYLTSEVKLEGDITIEELRGISLSSHTRQDLKQFNKVNFEKTIAVVSEGNTYTVSEFGAQAILENTTTNVNLRVNKPELSTVVENKNVEFVLELNNDKETSDIYGTSVFEVVLPKGIKNINLKDVNLLYGEGFEIESSNIYQRDGQKVLRVVLKGLQKELSKGHITNGTTIVLNTDILLEEELPMQDVLFKAVYSNTQATEYKTGTPFEMGIANKAFEPYGNGVTQMAGKFVSPEGLVVANRVINFNKTGEEVGTIKQGNKEALLDLNSNEIDLQEQIMLINNSGQELNGAVLFGRLPVEGAKDPLTGEDLGNNLELGLVSEIKNVSGANVEYQVFYSENVNANYELENPVNGWKQDSKGAKAYLVRINSVIPEKQVMKFNMALRVPAGLDYNKKTVGTNQAIYTLKTVTGTETYISQSDKIRLTTGEGVSLATSLNAEYANVEKGGKVQYLHTVVNESKTRNAENIETYIEMPQGIELLQVYSAKEELPFSRDERGNVKFSTRDLAPGEKETVRLELKVSEVFSGERVELKARTKSSASAVVQEAQSSETAVTVKKIEVTTTKQSETFFTPGRVTEGEEFEYQLSLENNSGTEKLSGVNIVVKLPQDISVTDVRGVEETFEVEKKSEKEIVVKNVTIENTNLVLLKMKVSKIGTDLQYKQEVTTIEVYDEKNELVDREDIVEYLVKPIFIVDSSTNKQGTYVEEGDIIEYKYKVKNAGSLGASANIIKFTVPENSILISKVVKDSTQEKLVDLNTQEYDEQKLQIDSQSEKEYIYKVKIGSNKGVERRSISAQFKISGPEGDIDTTPITHIVEKNKATREKEDMVRRGEVKLSEEEVKSLGVNIQDKNEAKITRNYEISGKAWNDENQNGIYEENEKLLGNIVAKLIDTQKGKVVKTVMTNEQGTYTFKDVPNGNYSVMFEYESQKYEPTVFKKNQVTETKTSDALGTVVKNGAAQKQIAVSDAIKINFQSKSNEDLGLVKNNKFDLGLESEIEKVTVKSNGKGNTAKVVDTNEKGIKKGLVSVFTNKDSNVEITYNLKVKNYGEILGRVSKISAKIPEGLKVKEGQEINWELKEGKLYTKATENVEIAKGQQKEIKLVLEGKYEKLLNKGFLVDFEIVEASNNEGIRDVNSTPGNGAVSENDSTSINLIIKKNHKPAIIGAIIAIFTVVTAVVANRMIKVRKNKKSEVSEDKGKGGN